MSRDIVKDIEKQISNSILRTLFVSLFAIAMKVLQLVMFHNSKTGLLNLSFLSNLFGMMVVVCMLYVTVEYVLLTIKVKKIAGYVNLVTQPLIGLSLVMVGVCFLFQGIMGILTSLTTGTSTALSSIISILTIISAVAYGIQGLEIISEKRKRHFLLNMVPVVWSIAVLMNVMLTYPTTVSVQSNISKVICCGLLVMFLYYTARWACGYEQSFMSAVGVFFRISFSALTLMFVLPYCLVYLFGIKDSVQNMPYLALLGLSIYGFIVLLQYMALSLHKIEMRNKLK
ncbi:MAG: hypothetical protein WAX04_07345 [Oscillospiraceae bacterium]